MPDFQLFDGQQRLTAILLGLGEGQLRDRLKLWVDVGGGKEPSHRAFVEHCSGRHLPFGKNGCAQVVGARISLCRVLPHFASGRVRLRLERGAVSGLMADTRGDKQGVIFPEDRELL